MRDHQSRAVVENVQGNARFLFSYQLKGRGVGLTLTGADTVVHFDPWWNPAVGRPATDACPSHRPDPCGDRYKLIMRATVEEKILALQPKKRAIIQATLGGERRWQTT